MRPAGREELNFLGEGVARDGTARTRARSGEEGVGVGGDAFLEGAGAGAGREDRREDGLTDVKKRLPVSQKSEPSFQAHRRSEHQESNPPPSIVTHVPSLPCASSSGGLVGFCR